MQDKGSFFVDFNICDYVEKVKVDMMNILVLNLNKKWTIG